MPDGAYLGIRSIAPSMRKNGGVSVVKVSSITGLHPTPDAESAAYGASKWGLRAWTITAAKELARDKIPVNSVHLGIIDTPLALFCLHPVSQTPIAHLTGPITQHRQPLGTHFSDSF